MSLRGLLSVEACGTLSGSPGRFVAWFGMVVGLFLLVLVPLQQIDHQREHLHSADEAICGECVLALPFIATSVMQPLLPLRSGAVAPAGTAITPPCSLWLAAWARGPPNPGVCSLLYLDRVTI
jgi:hypothetical protein